MKILYLITKSNYGGAQKYVFDLAVTSRADGCEVSVASGGGGKASAPTGKLVEKLSSTNIPTRFIKNFQRDMAFFSDILAFFEVWQLVRKIRPDVLHVTSSKAGGIGALAGRLAGTNKIIFTSHGLTIDETWRPHWQRVLIYLGTWLTIFLAHKTIMISTETFARARQMPFLTKKVFLVKNGIAPISFLSKNEARNELAPTIPKNSFWIGGIGELHRNKNWSSLIHAMLALPTKTHLIIIGEGEERIYLERKIESLSLQNRVHLLGFIDGDKYLKALDVFVLPSQKEGLPYVLMEAGLAELPVVASNLPGNEDIIETGETGFLIEPTPKLLSTTIEMLIRDEGLGRRLGHNLHASVTQNFSIEKMFAETSALYKS